MKKLLLLVLPLVLLMTACAAQQEAAEAPAAAVPDGLTVSISSLSQEVAYLDYVSNGVAMQLLAYADANGTPHLAYNTCQVCAGSPYAYFAEQNGMLVCQNCHNAFPYSVIGQAGYGCMPIALTDYTVDGDTLNVSADTLSAMESSFKNWKKGL